LIEYLSRHPCVDCGEEDIVALESDHLDGEVADVSKYANGGRTRGRILVEIAKCEVRRANCHRRKTAERARGRERSRSSRRRRPVHVSLAVATNANALSRGRGTAARVIPWCSNSIIARTRRPR